MLGRTEPRLWTPPLRPLTPDSTYGYDVIAFADVVLGMPLDPWEAWAAIHLGELLPDGRPRFRKVLVLVARQNGKTHLLVVLALFFLFVHGDRDEHGRALEALMVLGTSTKLDYARESWQKAVALARRTPSLRARLPGTRNNGIRQANGEQELATADGSRYKIAPANEEGGRSLSPDLAVLDELRQHRDYSAWDAIVPATYARRLGQVVAISNMGDDRSIVLNELRDEALHVIETGDGDDRLGLFEWSCPPDADPTDLAALAQANPNLGRRIDPDTLLADARAAVRAGGEKLTGFRTEIMCIRVPNLDPAIDPTAWAACADPGDLAAVRNRVALCLDVSLDGLHATLCAAAALDDGRTRLEVVQAWTGPDAARDLAAALPGLVARIRPRAVGWLPTGPAAALAGDVKPRAGAWPPAYCTVEAIRGEASAVCMGLADLVQARQVAQPGDDELLDAHVLGAEKLHQGETWRFTRRGAGHVDAAYAAAGAVHLARTLPRAGRAVVILPTGV